MELVGRAVGRSDSASRLVFANSFEPFQFQFGSQEASPLRTCKLIDECEGACKWIPSATGPIRAPSKWSAAEERRGAKQVERSEGQKWEYANHSALGAPAPTLLCFNWGPSHSESGRAPHRSGLSSSTSGQLISCPEAPRDPAASDLDSYFNLR